MSWKRLVVSGLIDWGSDGSGVCWYVKDRADGTLGSFPRGSEATMPSTNTLSGDVYKR
jgi:hypothetical protein